jgi:hypothetical protein
LVDFHSPQAPESDYPLHPHQWKAPHQTGIFLPLFLVFLADWYSNFTKVFSKNVFYLSVFKTKKVKSLIVVHRQYKAFFIHASNDVLPHYLMNVTHHVFLNTIHDVLVYYWMCL